MNSRSASICFRPQSRTTDFDVANKVCSSSRCPPPASPCDRCRRSCNILFGSWEEHELESLLRLQGCCCMTDISARIHIVSKQDPDGHDTTCSILAVENDSNSDNDEDTHMSYHEWISWRPPVKLPPGLPRPPLHPPAFSPRSAVTSDDDLEEDCEEWYNRNVANGKFPDWLRDQQQPSPDASPPQPQSSCGGGCNNRDLDDSWLNRNVAAGLFASWLASASGEPVTSCDVLKTLEEQISHQQFFSAAGLSSVDSGILERSSGISSVAHAHTAAVYWPAAGACNPSSCFSVASSSSTVGKDRDDNAFCCDALYSPIGSDCRTAITSEDCSRGSSRSCSSLSLGSLDPGSGGGCSSCDEGDEEDASRDVGTGKAGQLLVPGFEGSSRCCDVYLEESACERVDTAFDVSTPAPEGDTGDVSLVRLVDCTSWELEVEAQQLRLALTGVAAPVDGYSSLVLWNLHGRGAGGPSAWGCGALEGCSWEEDMETPASAFQSPWIETQLEGLLDDVVAGALFGDVGDEDGELLV
ncbi:hypothetical protein Vretimale_12332 [Volvox reticuliferus]|uniref:Uncharacterized protein n=2 Tax=Volvox reticuliferus TaxID=1737510 RepID=A0A8J4LSW6_9CHLO|nr:hypothetical protein Vretimale_12332 [Volvox reticuliferus]